MTTEAAGEVSGWIVLFRAVIMPILILILALSLVPIWIWMERKVAARLQQREGPNRVGPNGLLQPIADALKLLFKEDIIPSHADKLVYLLAPIVALIPTLAALAVVPLGDDLSLRQYLLWGPVVATVPMQVADLNVGVLWVLALSSVAVYGIVLAGWSSNNKWSLMGGVRSAAQMVSYELGMGAAIIAVVLSTSAFAAQLHSLGLPGVHALSLRATAESQAMWGFLSWNVIWHFPAAAIFAIAALAESNRAPFDLPEAEQELVAGFHTEYSSFRFAMFFMGEYAHMTTLSAVGTALFLGGWTSPFANWPLLGALTVEHVPILGALAPILWFIGKIVVCIYLYMWVRWTLPRFRWDQLMKLGWLVLLPLGMVWIVYVAIVQGIATAVAGPGRIWEGVDELALYRALTLIVLVVVGAWLWLRREHVGATVKDRVAAAREDTA